MAGLACARTLMQAGHDVHVYERLPQAGGRMRSVNGAQGAFDIGAQYFTVRDARFEQALQTVPGLCRPWSVSTLRVLDAQGRQSSAAPAPTEAHWVATPDMQALPMAWAAPLWDAGRLHLGQRVTRLERHGGAASWRLHLETIESTAQVVESGFDAVVLALPAPGPPVAADHASGPAPRAGHGRRGDGALLDPDAVLPHGDGGWPVHAGPAVECCAHHP